MPKTPKTAINAMIFYVCLLLVLGIVAGSLYTWYGRPSNPSEQSASTEMLSKPADQHSR